MTDLLFDPPWWLPAALALVGVAVFVSGNRRQQRRTRAAGLLIVLLAAGVVVVSYLVDTPVERASKDTRRLVAAVVAKDATTMKSLLDPKSSVGVLQASTRYGDRQSIINGAIDAVDRYGIRSARILSLDARQTGTTITVTINVFSEQEATMGRPLTTSWQFDWIETGEGWKLITITCLRIGDATGESAARQFPPPRP